MLLLIAFVLFAALFAAWLIAPVNVPAPKPAPDVDGLLPDAQTSVA